MPERPRVFYVSYDGMEEPLGRSQVLAYLTRLAADYEITLISFEKHGSPARATELELEQAGIEWMPLRYHRRPPVISTLLDVLAGRRALVHASRSGKPAIVHVRSDVPALMALAARRRIGGKLLFDIRGFWADERVEGGLWPAGGVLYRIARRCERRFYAAADAIVTLTHASVPQIREWTGGRHIPVEVIPTCVELGRFAREDSRPGGPNLVWSGSVGTWYRFDLVPGVAAAVDLPLLVVTRQQELANKLLAGYPAVVRSARPDELPDQLYAGDIGLCLIRSSFSKTASAPTRLAEYLAAGMPVLVTPKVGDLERIVQDHGVGVVLRGEDQDAFSAAAREISAMAADVDFQRRCRAVAAELFDVDAGAARYAALYRLLTGATSPPGAGTPRV